MTIGSLSLARSFYPALLAAMLLLPFASAHAQAQAPKQVASEAQVTSTGQHVFWCQDPSGKAAMQTESCAPGKEIRSQLVGPGGRVPAQPASAVAFPDTPAAAARPGAPAAAPETATAAAIEGVKASVAKFGWISFLRLIGFGLVFGVIGKLLGRSFWLWAAVGCAVRIVLVWLNVMKF